MQLSHLSRLHWRQSRRSNLQIQACLWKAPLHYCWYQSNWCIGFWIILNSAMWSSQPTAFAVGWIRLLILTLHFRWEWLPRFLARLSTAKRPMFHFFALFSVDREGTECIRKATHCSTRDASVWDDATYWCEMVDTVLLSSIDVDCIFQTLVELNSGRQEIMAVETAFLSDVLKSNRVMETSRRWSTLNIGVFSDRRWKFCCFVITFFTLMAPKQCLRHSKSIKCGYSCSDWGRINHDCDCLWQALQTLDLTNNYIGSRGMNYLSNALKLNQVRISDL